nr:MAG: hypothetical protein 1 [Leviviridae sp.]
MPTIPMPTIRNTAKTLGVRYYVYPAYKWHSDHWLVGEHTMGSKWSLGHRRDPDGKYRQGGPFYTVKRGRTCSTGAKVTAWLQDTRSGPGYGPEYIGTFGCNWASLTHFSDYSSLSMNGETTEGLTADLFVYGAEAYAKLRPDRPDFAPLTSLAELARELPSLIAQVKQARERYFEEIARLRRKGVRISNQSKRHLAIQFGLMPLMSDVVSFWEAYESSARRLNQLQRDNNKWVRRRAFLYGNGDKNLEDPVKTGTVVHTTAKHPNMIPNLGTDVYSYGTKATTEYYRKKYHRVWAVGKSRYILPTMYFDPKLQKALRRKLDFNLDVNFETLYNLMPWSWLADYFASIGGLASALSGGLADSIVFKYAYIMREEYDQYTEVLTQRVNTSRYPVFNATKVSCTVTRLGVKRSREAANLFGFGVTYEQLTAKQVGILGALGLSRL